MNTLEIFPTKRILEDTQTACARANMFPDQLAVTCSPKDEKAQRVLALVDDFAALRMPSTIVPHIAARRLKNLAEAQDLGRELKRRELSNAFIIGGDGNLPERHHTAIALMETLLPFGVRRIGVAGYPQGHSHISDDDLKASLRRKVNFSAENGVDMYIVTQFCPNPKAIINWVRSLRADGIDSPVIVGIPGPTSLKQLWRFVCACGMMDSSKFVRKNLPLAVAMMVGQLRGDDGLTNMIVRKLESSMDFAKEKIAGFHIFSFNNVRRSLEWIAASRNRKGNPDEEMLV